MDIESRALLVLRTAYTTYLKYGTADWADPNRVTAYAAAFIVSGRYPA